MGFPWRNVVAYVWPVIFQLFSDFLSSYFDPIDYKFIVEVFRIDTAIFSQFRDAAVDQTLDRSGNEAEPYALQSSFEFVSTYSQ